jgi:PBSX family phage terminase large subunit
MEQLMLYYAQKPNMKIMLTTLSYSQAKKIMKELLNGIENMNIIKSFNRSENSIILINGTEIFFKSVKLPDNIVGEDIDYMFCDEAALYKDGIFDLALRPMLKVRGKKCFFFSTPRGKNWFYKMYQRGADDRQKRYECYKGSAYGNPFANKEEIEDARKCLPPALFRQEYLGEFVDDGGDVFNEFKNLSVIDKWISPISGEIYYAGIDLGRQNDFTVLTILNKRGEVVMIYRDNNKSWPLLVSKLASILKKYNPRYTLVESNGIGDVVYDLLKAQYSKIEAFTTSINSKQMIIEELILAFDEKTLRLPSVNLFKVLSDELSDFTFNYNKKTRNISYAARTGHDDTVMSLAFANHAMKHYASRGQYRIY